jgi:hypothetical protein
LLYEPENLDDSPCFNLVNDDTFKRVFVKWWFWSSLSKD